MSKSDAGKGSKNRLKGNDLKKYGESKLWASIDKKKEKEKRK